jgi:drug/metabolite transporter (DMT)-like permease
MNISKNASVKHNPITTILGLIMVAAALGMYLIPYFYDPKHDPNVWVPAGIGVVGLFLILAPDELIPTLKKKIENGNSSQNN